MMIIVSDYSIENKEGYDNSFVISRDICTCPVCQSAVRHRDWKKRITRHDGGETEFIYIERVKCTNEECGKLHSKLPNMLLCNKHYVEELITGVIDGDIVQEDLMNENYPCDETMRRWNNWFAANEMRMEEYIRSIKYSDYNNEDYSVHNSVPLLEAERNKDSRWLVSILQMIYNSGGFL